MKLKLLLAFMVILYANQIGSQTVDADNYKFKFIRAKKNNRFMEGTTRVYNVNVDRDKSKKIQVRFKIYSINKEKDTFDPNKLYLITEKYQCRLRPLDITRNFGAGWIFYGFSRLIKEPSNNKKVKEWANYKPEVNDTYKDYYKFGYQDVSPRINVGTNKKPVLIEPYYDLDEIKSCKIDVYFGVPKELEEGQLFYGETLIADFSL